jgi:hypothetical protein
LTPVQYSDIFGFLNVDVSSDGKSLAGTFYDNADGEIKDRFTITKSSETAAATSSSGTDDSSSNDSDDDSSLFNDSSDDSVFPDSEGSSDGDIYDGDSESSG